MGDVNMVSADKSLGKRYRRQRSSWLQKYVLLCTRAFLSGAQQCVRLLAYKTTALLSLQWANSEKIFLRVSAHTSQRAAFFIKIIGIRFVVWLHFCTWHLTRSWQIVSRPQPPMHRDGRACPIWVIPRASDYPAGIRPSHADTARGRDLPKSVLRRGGNRMVESCCFFVLRPRVMRCAAARSQHQRPIPFVVVGLWCEFLHVYGPREKHALILRLFHFFSTGPQIYCTIKVAVLFRFWQFAKTSGSTETRS